MGWMGADGHDGYLARLLTDGSDSAAWSASTRRRMTGGGRAACDCGWRGATVYPAAAGDVAEERARTEWRDTHLSPLIDPEPEHVLHLGSDAGGPRHFLGGRPVHCGTVLELRLADDRWARVRYEWSFASGSPPTAYVLLGGRGSRLGVGPPAVALLLPSTAELRWPKGQLRT